MASEPNDAEADERAVYDAAYKRVSDALTLYVWRRPAFHLTRWAMRAGLTPNMITAAGAVLCVVAFVAFWRAHYWLGLIAAGMAMALDIVDGQLARCAGSSSKPGAMFDRAIGLTVPPFLYWAWEHGLAAYGRPLVPVAATMILLAVIAGFVADRVVEVIFIKRFDGMPIDAWRAVDSRFRLIAAGRNVNLVILLAAMLIARPDLGLQWVAWWTVISAIFHAVGLAQATEQAARGKAVKSWLEP